MKKVVSAKLSTELNFDKKSQVSMEYLAIFSIAMVMTLLLIVIFVSQIENIQSDITNSEVQKISSKIIDYSESVYYMGEPAQKTLNILFPRGITSIEIDSNIIIFNVTTTDSSYQIVKDTIANLSGSIGSFEGQHNIVFKSLNNTVFIYDK